MHKRNTTITNKATKTPIVTINTSTADFFWRADASGSAEVNATGGTLIEIGRAVRVAGNGRRFVGLGVAASSASPI
jgi:hypothetical protein